MGLLISLFAFRFASILFHSFHSSKLEKLLQTTTGEKEIKRKWEQNEAEGPQ